MDTRGEAWRPSATLEVLRQRALILRQLRAFFDAEGYWEVETPLLSRDVCIDASIDPFAVTAGSTMFLQTSPEFALKRLLCTGADALFEVTRSFRADETGRLHNPEFTIVEWYRIGATCHEQMGLVERLVRSLIAADGPVLRQCGQVQRITYDDAFVRFAGVSALSSSDTELRDRTAKLGCFIPQSLRPDDRDGWLNLILAEVVEPRLAELGAVFLYDYPASQSAIARIKPGCPSVAERFELYLDGIEICNGYQELTDPEELLRRMEQRNQQRITDDNTPLPTNSRLIEAMHAGRLPECSGVALGFDRLVMWLLGKTNIAEVMAFPRDRA
jgi:elongation factor P--(R)-beta-lysine ligase